MYLNHDAGLISLTNHSDLYIFNSYPQSLSLITGIRVLYRVYRVTRLVDCLMSQVYPYQYTDK